MSKKVFVNPLTRSSETELHVPLTFDKQDEVPSDDNAMAADGSKQAKEKGKIFEATHQRFTSWIDKELKKQFDELLAKRGVTKTAMLDEAIAGLLHKYNRKPYTRQKQIE